MNKKLGKRIAAAFSCAALLSFGAAQAADEPASLDADEVTYNMESGEAVAEGNVLMKRGASAVTGAKATYNAKTMEGTVEGGVIAVHGATRLTCSFIRSDGNGHYFAQGSVRGTQEDKTFSGERVDYYPNQNEYVLIASGGTLTSADGTFTADRLEGWLNDEHYIGTGSAHLVSPPRSLEAGGDRLDYYGKENGKAVLTGNAWAYQGNNTMRGNRLTLYLANDGATK
ncbi:MAG: LptA/OstA family protein [Mitsuokella sp.]